MKPAIIALFAALTISSPALACSTPKEATPEQLSLIRKNCQKDWENDFRMMLYCEKRQLEALRELKCRGAIQ